MNALTSKVPPPPAVFFRMMIALTVVFFLLVGATVMMLRRSHDNVPLNPCRQCANSCPCPRMNGSVRCGCPQ